MCSSDLSLIRARDGSYYLAWLSDRDGNDDIYVMRSRDGQHWDAPVRVTTNADPDWYPSLVQSRDGRFHVVWFRPMTVQPFYRHVYANSSDDGLTWNPQNEVQVTSGVTDDWAPMMLETSGGELLVYFSSQARGTSGTSDLYLSRSTDQGASWPAPTMLATASDPAQMEVFPYVVERAAGDLVMVFVRYAPSGGSNYFDSTTDLFRATSSDGVSWTGVFAITNDDASGFVDSIPSLYASADRSRWFILWTSTGPTAPATPKILDLALGDAYPAAALDATAAHGMLGYSAHAVATDTPRLYLGVWVHDIGSKRLEWQLFAR